MTDLPSHADTGEEPGLRPATGRSRWKSVAGIAVAIAVLVLLGVLHLIGVIGPGSH